MLFMKSLSFPLSLPPLSTHTQHCLEPFIILIMALAWLVHLFWDRSVIFFSLLWRLVQLAHVDARKRAVFLCVCIVTIKHRQAEQA